MFLLSILREQLNSYILDMFSLNLGSNLYLNLGSNLY